jgi:hypothetical protein
MEWNQRLTLRKSMSGGIINRPDLAKGPVMLAIVAAVLFGLALIFQLAGFALDRIDSQLLVVAGLLCLALFMAGVGTRSRSWRRARR